MKKWSLCAVLFFSLIASGCATHQTVPLVDGIMPLPPLMTKLPLNAAILINEPLEHYIATVKDEADLLGATYTFPLGQIVRQTALDALSPAFNRAVLITGPPYPPGTDVTIVPKIETFRLRMSPDGFSRKASAAVSIRLGVHDTDGRLIWQETSASPLMPGKSFSLNNKDMLEAAGGVASHVVAVTLQTAAKAMTVSGELQAVAAAKGKPQSVAHQPAPEPKPAVATDVDDPPAMGTPPNRNAFAIVIGIEAYRQKLPKADFAVRDATTVAQYLTRAMGYPAENVVLMLNDRATNVDLVKYFEKWLSNNVEPGGRVFVYYSGHGAPDPETGGSYLVPYDGDPSFIAETGYSLKRMYAALGRLPASEIVVALDACFSGSGGRSVLAQGARPLVMNLQNRMVLPKRMTVLAASSGSQISSTYHEMGHGLLTYFMLRGLRDEGVINPDGSIRMDDLYGFLKPQVERIARRNYNNEQTPELMVGK